MSTKKACSTNSSRYESRMTREKQVDDLVEYIYSDN